MEFDQQMTDIPVNVSCKIAMYIFKIAPVINENVRIYGILYVLSIFTKSRFNNRNKFLTAKLLKQGYIRIIKSAKHFSNFIVGTLN